MPKLETRRVEESQQAVAGPVRLRMQPMDALPAGEGLDALDQGVAKAVLLARGVDAHGIEHGHRLELAELAVRNQLDTRDTAGLATRLVTGCGHAALPYPPCALPRLANHGNFAPVNGNDRVRRALHADRHAGLRRTQLAFEIGGEPIGLRHELPLVVVAQVPDHARSGVNTTAHATL